MKGTVIKAGTLIVDEEKLTGVFIEVNRKELAEQELNYLYKPVTIEVNHETIPFNTKK